MVFVVDVFLTKVLEACRAAVEVRRLLGITRRLHSKINEKVLI